jgi:lactoylglutathione lyase
MSPRFELFADDPEKSVAFYTDVLGFGVQYSNNGYHSLVRGATTIGIGSLAGLRQNHYFRPEITSQRKGLGTEIVLEVGDIQAEHDRIEASSYPILEGLKKHEWGLTDFRVVDPAGYYLRITSRD